MILDPFELSQTRLSNILICQLDGADDISSEEDHMPNKKIFSVSCEANEVVNLMNFFRSFNDIWILTNDHQICDLNKNCLFCNMRSSCLRLRRERNTGPKSLKVNEFTSQLFHFGDDWRSFSLDLKRFIEVTVNLLIKCDIKISEKFLKLPVTQA